MSEGMIRWAFYEWMAALSIDEIISNKDLICQIEMVQKILLGSYEDGEKI